MCNSYSRMTLSCKNLTKITLHFKIMYNSKCYVTKRRIVYNKEV